MLYRFYFWGVHGIFSEVVFTAIWSLVVNGDYKLMGQSSIWSFFVYGLGAFYAAELLRDTLRARHVPTWARCILYVPMVYAWEFACGVLLRYYDVCPWDYTDFSYNIMGLITMEYAPLWLMGGAYFELLMSHMSTLEVKPLWKQQQKFDKQ